MLPDKALNTILLTELYGVGTSNIFILNVIVSS